MGGALAGTGTMVAIAVRTGWKSLLAWIVGLAGLLAISAASIGSLYDTPEKVAGYAAAMGESAVLLNGRVAGIDTLGGVVANEFGFIAGLAVPLMAVALVIRLTRREEESGRTEMLLAAGVGRLAPSVAALAVTATSFLLLGLGCLIALLPADIDTGAAVVYSLSLVALGLVFAGLTALLAQVFTHSRSVWIWALTTVVISFLIRGVGDVHRSRLSWFSPLGWQGKVAAFGDHRLLPLVISLSTALVLAAVAIWMAGRRDLGAGLVPVRTGAGQATPLLRRRIGVVLHEQFGVILGWTVGAIAFGAMFGSLLQAVLDALLGNPDLAVFVGEAPDPLDPVLQMLVRMNAYLAAGYALQAIGRLGAEEESGRLEMALAGPRSRRSWMGAHAAVVAVGATVVTLAGGAAFAVTAQYSLDSAGLAGRILAAVGWQLPAVAVFLAAAVMLFGAAPRWAAVRWVFFAAAVVVSYMGQALQLGERQMRLSPFHAVGDAPGAAVSVTGVTVLLLLSAGLTVFGLGAFRRRDVPKG